MIAELPPAVAALWPYRPRWTEVDGYRLHHVDEGPRTDGDAVVLLHGNPTWGFLYRNIIPPIVAAGFRVVVPDYLGFGRSDHARGDGGAWPDTQAEYAIDEHARRLLAQLDNAGVRRAVIFAQDWGGPISLAATLSRPALLAGLVLANTFWGAASVFQRGAAAWRSLHAPVSGALLLGKRRMFVNGLRRSGPPATRDGAVWQAYTLPFDAHGGPGGTFAFPRAISTGPGHPTQPLVEAIWAALPGMDVPTRFVWGDRDAVFTRDEQEAGLRSRLPRAGEHTTVVVEGGRHFVQEYGPQQCADAVIAVATEAFGRPDPARVAAPVDASVDVQPVAAAVVSSSVAGAETPVLVEHDVWPEFVDAVRSLGDSWTAPSGRAYRLRFDGRRLDVLGSDDDADLLELAAAVHDAAGGIWSGEAVRQVAAAWGFDPKP